MSNQSFERGSVSYPVRSTFREAELASSVCRLAQQTPIFQVGASSPASPGRENSAKRTASRQDGGTHFTKRGRLNPPGMFQSCRRKQDGNRAHCLAFCCFRSWPERGRSAGNERVCEAVRAYVRFRVLSVIGKDTLIESGSCACVNTICLPGSISWP